MFAFQSVCRAIEAAPAVVNATISVVPPLNIKIYFPHGILPHIFNAPTRLRGTEAFKNTILTTIIDNIGKYTHELGAPEYCQEHPSSTATWLSKQIVSRRQEGPEKTLQRMVHSVIQDWKEGKSFHHLSMATGFRD
jgi:hypothetical protein